MVKIEGETSEQFGVGVGLRRKCIESPAFHYGDEPDQWKGI